MLIKGRTWVFGRHVNTDLIFPKMWFRPAYQPGEMASHLMVGLDENFPSKVMPGDIIVGGLNFGCGSSREEAAAAMKEAGISAAVAPTFGRIFTRNCINVGLPIVISFRPQRSWPPLALQEQRILCASACFIPILPRSFMPSPRRPARMGGTAGYLRHHDLHD
jgi:3-isopropylmalate dehydratase small subunit